MQNVLVALSLLLATAVSGSARAELTPISLVSSFNVHYNSNWITCCGYERWVASPDLTYASIPFTLAAQSDPQHGVAVGNALRSAVTIPVDAHVDVFHTIVSGGWSTCGTTNAVDILYADGGTARTSWATPEWTHGCSDAAVHFVHPNGTPIKLYYRAAANPNPSRVVHAVRLVPGGPQMFLAALTVEGDAASEPPVADCLAWPADDVSLAGTDLVLECDASGSRQVVLDGSGSTGDGDLGYQWEVDDGMTLAYSSEAVTVSALPLGESVATLTVTDDGGAFDTCDVVVTVQNTTAPTVHVDTDLVTLWPPDLRAREVQIRVQASAACGDSLAPPWVTVRSDEPDDTSGPRHRGDVDGHDGFTSPVEITGFVFEPALGAWTRTVLLRAERADPRRGRVYTVEVAVMDGSGNVGTSRSAVIVPGASPMRENTPPVRSAPPRCHEPPNMGVALGSAAMTHQSVSSVLGVDLSGDWAVVVELGRSRPSQHVSGATAGAAERPFLIFVL